MPNFSFVDWVKKRGALGEQPAIASDPVPPSELTPSREAIAAARERQSKRTFAWRKLDAAADGEHFHEVRAMTLCAADVKVAGDAADQSRNLRSLLFDTEGEFFVRDMIVSQDRYLIEFRHPDLRASDGSTLRGLRFIGLKRAAWRSAGDVCLLFDGRHLALPQLIGTRWKETFTDPNLAELYVRFVLDTAEFSGSQWYVISDPNDFVTNDVLEGHSAAGTFADLTAQFRVSPQPPPAGTETADTAASPFAASGVPEAMLIPPTTVRIDPQPALVFATVVHRQQLHHLCLAISADGKIGVVEDWPRTTPDGTLPVHPLRSFDEQRAALGRVKPEGAVRQQSS